MIEKNCVRYVRNNAGTWDSACTSDEVKIPRYPKEDIDMFSDICYNINTCIEDTVFMFDSGESVKISEIQMADGTLYNAIKDSNLILYFPYDRYEIHIGDDEMAYGIDLDGAKEKEVLQQYKQQIKDCTSVHELDCLLSYIHLDRIKAKCKIISSRHNTSCLIYDSKYYRYGLKIIVKQLSGESIKVKNIRINF